MSEEERDYTAEAREQGWNPDHEGENKVDAKTFVERGEKIIGIVKSKNARLEGRIETLEQSNREFGEYHKRTIETQRKQSAEKVAELETQLAKAVTEGDGQAYTQTQREIESVKAQTPNPTNDAQAWDRMAQNWAGENKWYADNKKLATYADGISDRIRAEGYNGQAYFSELTRRVHEDFPEEFTNPNKTKPSGVEAGGQRGTGTSDKPIYDNLDAEAKAACDGYVKEGFMTRDDYVKTYFEEGGPS